MTKERFKIIPAVYLVLKKDGRILLSRRYNTGHEDGKYSLISGHLEGNESFKQTMIREAAEEAGIVLDPDGLDLVHITHKKINGEGERVDIFFSASEWKGEIRNMEPEKCSDLKWFPLNELPQNMVSYVDHALKKVNKNIIYSDLDF